MTEDQREIRRKKRVLEYAEKHGNIFSIDVGPNYAGRLREIDVKTLKEVGEIIRAGDAP